MKTLVTGGAGFIGSHLVERLLKDSQRVVVIDNFSTGKKENLSNQSYNKNLFVYKRDITADLTDIFEKEKFDFVFHLAALPRVQYSIDYPAETHQTNVEGTFNLLNCSKNFKVKRFILSSSSSIYGDQDKLPLVETMVSNPISPYALHKLIGEQYCQIFYKIYGLETISLRYFNVYGPRQSLQGGYANLIPRSIGLILNSKSPQYTNDGKQTRDFTFVTDVVEANIKAAKTNNSSCFGQAFNIGAGKNISVLEVFKILIKLSGKKLRPEFLEKRLEPKDTLADVSKAKELLGWEPKVNFQQGIKKEWDYFVSIF